MADQFKRPAPIRTDTSNEFAHYSMAVRMPGIIDEVLQLNPDYSPPIKAALENISQAIQANAPIALIDLPAPDYDGWASLYAEYAGTTWLATDWFFAEFYFYRHIMQAVRWWETGWDPFAPKKELELTGEGLWAFLKQALETSGATPLEKLPELLHYTLWGNRMDLSYAASQAHGSTVGSDDLLVDDSALAIAQLQSGRGPVHMILDNAGTELAADLALVAALLELGIEQVFLHVKIHPIFVSDTTVPDILHFLDLLDSRGPDTQPLGTLLREAITAGRLRLAPDLFWNLGRFMWDLPPRLVKTLEGARLVILKGDANYRRTLGDALWPLETPFADVVSYFPAPLLAIRTIKSDPVIGLPAELARRLDQVEPRWRVSGKHGLIQYAPR